MVISILYLALLLFERCENREPGKNAVVVMEYIYFLPGAHEHPPSPWPARMN
jgi:hypothetical protein